MASFKFSIGQQVEFTKDFPSIGVAAGDRLYVWSRNPAIDRGRKIVPERYGFREHPAVRIYVDHLRGVE